MFIKVLNAVINNGKLYHIKRAALIEIELSRSLEVKLSEEGKNTLSRFFSLR